MPRRSRPFKSKPKREPFPWVAFLVLALTLALFWGLPYRLGNPPVATEGIRLYTE